ncbi:hypothetical protein ACFL0Q_01215 [Thermodesulfobacteriota bacterium]
MHTETAESFGDLTFLALENLKMADQNFKEMGMNYWLAKTQDVLARL